MEFNDGTFVGTSINDIGYIFTFRNKISWCFENENIINTFEVASSTPKNFLLSVAT